jgi:hypothetical protein
MVEHLQWETVGISEVQVGDTVACVVPRTPDWLQAGEQRAGQAPASHGVIEACQVYDWKAQGGKMPVVVITYKHPDGRKGTIKVSFSWLSIMTARTI